MDAGTGKDLSILAIGQVESLESIEFQINKQRMQPDFVYLYLDENPAKGIDNRRLKIAENHKKLVEVVEAIKPDLIWQVEGDGIYPDYTLDMLMADYQALDSSDFGYVSGVQVGRHGIYSIGGWHFDSEESFRSVDYREQDIIEIDASGFYCLLAKREAWLAGMCTWNGERWGPDVVWSRSVKAKGYKLYMDMDLHIGHATSRGIIDPTNLSTCNVYFKKVNGEWSYTTYD